MRLLLAAIALVTLGVLLLRKPQRVGARPYVDDSGFWEAGW